MMRPSRTGHAQDKRGFQTGDKQRGDLMLMNIFAVVPAFAGTTLSRWPRLGTASHFRIVDRIVIALRHRGSLALAHCHHIRFTE
jgi:hypothetical protein